MKPLGFPLLADENIGPDVVAGLRERGCNVRSVEEEDLRGQSDTAVLLRATDQHRAVITHDLAFGKSAIRAGTDFVGIIYLRPGHISGAFVLSVVDALGESTIDVRPPFVVVAERRDTSFRVRARNEPPW